MSEQITFLPWVRQGLGLGVGGRDRGSGPLPRGAAVGAWVELDGERVDVSLALRPVDHASGIDPTQIIRRFPAAGTDGAEHGYFPLVEIAAPDLPWVLTPTGPDEAPGSPTSNGRLRPWLVLVCVPSAEAVFTPANGDNVPTIETSAEHLPDLDESFAWAHVQSAVAAGDALAAMTTNPAAVIARLVCPRNLEPGTSYRAALVPAFVASGEQLIPAWSEGVAPTSPLPVFDTWTFTTGLVSSFQELCERLGPVDPELTLQLGLRPIDITDLGPVGEWHDEKQVTVDYTGALWDADLTAKELGNLKASHDAVITDLLNQTDYRVVLKAKAPDPVVGPPLYGAFAKGVHDVPDAGWQRALNLTPNRRAGAGLGAKIVRLHQERFMALAWQQAGEVRQANRELSITRLQAEVARTWQGRAEGLDAISTLSVFRSQFTFLRTTKNQAPRALVRQSNVPTGLLSVGALRMLRPGGVIRRVSARRENPETPSVGGALNEIFANPTDRASLGYAAVAVPDGTTFDDPRRYGLTPPATGGPIDPGDPGDPGAPGQQISALPVSAQPTVISKADSVDLVVLAGLTATLAPTVTSRARVTSRIPALDSFMKGRPTDDLPTRVAIGPTIDEALVSSLIQLSPSLLMPGVEDFPDESVRLVEANPAFVASFLAGANHEMTRELMWREYPADPGSTTFRRFWDRPDLAATDIDPMAGWGAKKALSVLGKGGGESVVVLIRGELVRHYPTVRVLLVDPDDKIGKLPSFAGWLPPDVRFLAFDVLDAQAVTAARSKWKIVIEEQPSQPRFGINAAEERAGDPTSWLDVNWNDLRQPRDNHLSISSELHLKKNQALKDAAEWGLNSAHMAHATYQPPFRITFRATDLLGSS